MGQMFLAVGLALIWATAGVSYAERYEFEIGNSIQQVDLGAGTFTHASGALRHKGVEIGTATAFVFSGSCPNCTPDTAARVRYAVVELSMGGSSFIVSSPVQGDTRWVDKVIDKKTGAELLSGVLSYWWGGGTVGVGMSFTTDTEPDPGTAAECRPAPAAQTGLRYAFATGGDGDLQRGIPWPVPRFTHNGNGTVTDNLTGLVWLRNAGCFAARHWGEALSVANSLQDGDCGLSDGSSQGDWRVPNIRELMSLLDYEYVVPALSNTNGTGKWKQGDPFHLPSTNDYYWSSTTYNDLEYSGIGAHAWYINIVNGFTSWDGKLSEKRALPVRDAM